MKVRTGLARAGRTLVFTGTPHARVYRKALAVGTAARRTWNVVRASTPAERKALTRVRAAPYHGGMNRRLSNAARVLLISAGLLGCEDAGKKTIQARVPALAP